MHTAFYEKYGKDAFDVKIVKDMPTDGAFDQVIEGQVGIELRYTYSCHAGSY